MKKMMLSILIILFYTLTALSGCSDKKESLSSPGKTTEAEQTPGTDTAVPPPSRNEAMAVFITGEVLVSDEGSSDRIDLEIGDVLTAGMNLEVGEGSYCELEFPDKAVIRIQEKTELSLSAILNESGKTGISLGLNKGTVLCRVNKLVKGEGFQIKTESSVAGVRGTEFLVTVDEQKSATLAVREGAVRFYPASLHPEVWESGEDEILAGLDKALPLIEAGKEMSISLGQSDEIADMAAELEENIRTGDDAAVESAETLKSYLLDELRGREKPLSDENRETLEQIDEIHEAGIAEGVEEPILIPLTIRTEPAEAEMLLDGRASGSTEVSMLLNEGESVQAEARLIGYRPVREELSAVRDKENLVTLKLIKIPPQSVTVQVSPGSAQISEAGTAPVTGELRLDVEYTETRTLTLAAPGYNRQQLTLKGDEALEKTYQIDLIPEIHRNYRPSTTAVIGVAASGDLTVSADRDGTLTAMDGIKKIWSLTTINTDNQTSLPVSAGDRIAFSGQNEFILAEGSSGRQLASLSLDLPDKHIFGRRVVEAGDILIFPGNEALKLYSKSDGSLLREVAIPGGSRMYPLYDGKRLYIVNLQGELLAMGLDGEIQDRLTTGASQMIGVSLIQNGEKAFFGDKKGKVFAVSLNPLRLLWTKDAAASGKVVFSDTLCTAEGGVFAYYRGRLYGFDTENGTPLFSPRSGLTTPPMSYGGYLYAGGGEQGVMVIDPPSGETVKTIALEEHQPLSYLSPVNGRIAVPCDDGWVYEINPLVRY